MPHQADSLLGVHVTSSLGEAIVFRHVFHFTRRVVVPQDGREMRVLGCWPIIQQRFQIGTVSVIAIGRRHRLTIESNVDLAKQRVQKIVDGPDLANQYLLRRICLLEIGIRFERDAHIEQSVRQIQILVGIPGDHKFDRSIVGQCADRLVLSPI